MASHSDKKVYYISLAAARQQNINHMAYTWLSPSVFDVANSMEFEDTKVIFLSVRDILPEDWKERKNYLLNHFLVDFMKSQPDSHFFIDELPILSKLDKKDPVCSPPDFSFLDQNSDSYVWLTIRPIELEKGLCTEYEKIQDRFRASLSKLGFDFPKLNLNMRNSSGVLQTSDTLYEKPDLSCYVTEEDVKNYKEKHEKSKLTVAKANL